MFHSGKLTGPSAVAAPPSLEENRYRPAPGIRTAFHDEGLALLDVHRGQVFLANRMGAHAWRGITAGHSVAAVSEQISREHRLSCDQSRRDTAEFAAELERRGLLRRERALSVLGDRLLLLKAFWELLRYDVVMAVCGFRRILTGLEGMAPQACRPEQSSERRVAAALALATTLYWKPVRCLQRSVAATRLLRRRGIFAQLVIGYRAAPFFSHAWTEVDGRVVNDSQGYRQRLSVLHRI